MASQKTQVKPGSDGSVSFEFSIPVADVQKGFQDVVREWAGTVEIKGFRKGKAPLDLVEKSLDRAKVYSHALEHILPHAYSQAIQTHKLIPIVEPRVTPLKMEEGQDWQFKAETAVRPDFKLGDYKKYVAAALKKLPKAKKGEKEGDSKNQGDPKLTAVLDALLRNVELEIAPILVDSESESALKRLTDQLSSLKLSLEDYLKSIKKTKEDLEKEYRQTATSNLKIELILAAIAADLKPDVKEQDPYKKYAAERRFVLDFLSGL